MIDAQKEAFFSFRKLAMRGHIQKLVKFSVMSSTKLGSLSAESPAAFNVSSLFSIFLRLNFTQAMSNLSTGDQK